MSPDKLNLKPRVGEVVFPLGEPGNSPPFVIVKRDPSETRQKATGTGAKRKAARKAARRSRKRNRRAA